MISTIMRILGIDPGTQELGWAVVDDGQRIVNYGVLRANHVTYEQRIPKLVDAAQTLFHQYKCDGLAMEKAVKWKGRNIAALEVLCRGLRKWAKPAMKKSPGGFGEYNVATWKSGMLGNRCADAELTAWLIENQFPWLPKGLSEHIHDAIYIALYHLMTLQIKRGE